MSQQLKKEGDINLGVARQAWQQQHLDNETQQLLAEDARYFLHQAMSTPCLNVLEGAEGIWLEDQQGRRYMDFHGNNVHQLGFNHPYLNRVLKQQLDELSFSTRRYTNPVAVDCARKLAELCPGDLNRVLFAPGGTSVIGIALKLARLVTGKHKVVSLWDSFHGASMDAIAVAGTHSFEQGLGPLLPGVERIPPPTSYRGIWTRENPDDGDIAYAEYLEYVLEKDPEIGVFLAETVRNTDAQIPSKAYWQKVRDICDRHNVLLILDEIPIALGRTGKMFAFEHYGIEPDILCLGKGLGGGIMPFAAMVTRDCFNIAADVSLGHYTHEKSPLGAAAALAVMEVIERDKLLEKTQQKGDFFAAGLKQLQQKYAVIGDVRGLGLLWGVELVTCRKSKQRATEAAEAVMYECLSAGLSFKVSQGNVLQLSPPLIIEQQNLQRALDILDQCLKNVSQRFNFEVFSEDIAENSSQPGSTLPIDDIIPLSHTDIIEVPVVKATQQNFVDAGFGELVYDFDQAEVDIVSWPQPGWREIIAGTGNEGGITSGEFIFSWQGDMAVARNHAVDGHYITGWFCDPAQASLASERNSHDYIYVREANYHPDGSQIFYPKDATPFVALLALPGDDVRPQDFIAFYCDGSFGIKIHPNIWHQPLFPLAEKADFLDKQGKVHACVGVDFVKEFGEYLKVGLKI